VLYARLQRAPVELINRSFWRGDSLLANLPAIVCGSFHFVGLLPRTKNEVQLLPSEWQQLYKQAPLGWAQLEEGSGVVDMAFLFARDVYYVTHHTLLNDFILFFKKCSAVWQRIYKAVSHRVVQKIRMRYGQTNR
jgi:lipopolysaccharide/colanic/teichoic acid biosynthesis glycosyltransferase